MPVTITAYVSRCGYSAYFFTLNSSTGALVPITGVPSNPSIQVNGTPVQIQGPYIDTVHTFPFAVYQLSCGSVASVVVQKGGTGYVAPVATASGGGPGGRSFYAAATVGSGGAGTLANPWKLGDLLTAGLVPGVAFTTLIPGDTLYFRAGTYTFSSNDLYDMQLLYPSVSGTISQPITLRNYPGEIPSFVMSSGSTRNQPLFGTTNPELDYIRIIGLKLTTNATAPRVVTIAGTGNEVGYCEIIGQDQPGQGDNHDGIRIENSTDTWIHHNNIHGLTDGGGGAGNNAGIKNYVNVNLLIEDNYIHANTRNIYDKDGGDGTIIRRNFITNDLGGDCVALSGQHPTHPATYFIYDNVIDGIINFDNDGIGSQVYNNLFRTTATDNGRVIAMFAYNEDTEGGSNLYNTQIWNNVIIVGNVPLWVYEQAAPLVLGGTQPTFQYFDYNFFDGTPGYLFNWRTSSVSYTKAQFTALGYNFEAHSAQVASVTTIYNDAVSYVLKTAYTTAGRFGDPVGPRVTIADILNTTRYGPAAAPTTSGPVLGTPVVVGGVIQSISVLSGGSGLTSSPTITITDSAGTGALAVAVMAGVNSTDTVTYTAPANWITTGTGNAPVAAATAMQNYKGSFEPGLGGHLDFGTSNAKTIRIGMGLSENPVETPDGTYSPSANWLHRGSDYIAGGTGGSVVTQDIGGQPLTMSGTISTQFDNCAQSNQVNNFGFPGQIGIWTLVVDDTNGANPASMMIHGLTGSSNAVITPLGTAGLVDPGVLIAGVQTGRVYQWNVQRVANPTAHRLALSHTVTRSPNTGTFNCTFRNAHIFDPVDTAAALPSYPVRVPLDITQQVKNWLNLPNGLGPSTLRWGSTNNTGYGTPTCDPDDLRNYTDLLWSSGKIHTDRPGWRRTVTVNTVRTYALPGDVFPVWTGIGSVTITNGGTGYVTPVATVVGGSGTGFTVGTIVKNAAGAITSVPVATQGINYQATPPTITITDSSGPGTGAVVVAVSLGGPVTWSSPEVELASWHTLPNSGIISITINSGGSGYTGTLSATIVGGTGNGLVLGVPTSSGGVITGVSVLVSGSYTVAPTITVVGATGTGCSVTPVMQINGFPIGTIRVTYGGTGYSAAPVATVSGGSGSGCTLGTPVVVGGVIKSIAVTARGSGYILPPDITITDSTGSGAIAYPNAITTPFNQSFLNPFQPGQSRFVLEMLTTTDHALKTGQLTYFLTSSGSFHYSNGPSVAFSGIVGGAQLICFVTGPRSFVAVQFSGNINTTGSGLPGTINNITGSYPVNCTFTIPLPPVAVPYEVAAYGSGTFPNCNHWVNLPTSATDKCVREIAIRTRDNLPPGRTVYVEWGDENWGFFTLYNYSGPAGKLGSFRNKMTTDIHGPYVDRAAQCHDIFVAVFNETDINGQTNRGSEISRLFGSQGGNSAVTNTMVKYTNLYNSGLPTIPIPWDSCAIAPYYDVLTAATSPTSMKFPYASLGSNVPTSIAYLWVTPWTRAGLIDYWRHQAVYSPTYNGFYGLGNSHFFILNNYVPPPGLTGPPKLVGYEGGIQTMTPLGMETVPGTLHLKLSTDFYYDPESIHAFRALTQVVQQGGMRDWVFFNFGSPLLLQGNDFLWPFQTSGGQPAGYGDGTGTTTTGFVPVGTPVINQFVGTGTTTYHERNASVFLQGWRDWANVSNVLEDTQGAITLARLVVAGVATSTADIPVDGHGAISLVRVTVAGAGRFTAPATGAVTLTRLTVAGSATFTPKIPANGSGAITLGSLVVAGVAKDTATSSGAVTLGSIVVAGVATAGAVPGGSGAITLASLSASGVGVFSAVATSTITLGSLTAAGVATATIVVAVDGHGDILLGALSVASVTRLTINASGDVTLGLIVGEGVATYTGPNPADAVGDIILGAMTTEGIATFFIDLPTILSVDPPTGPEAGGTIVTITGTGFTDAIAIRFGLVPSLDFTISSDFLAQVESPAGTDTVDITIETPLGTTETTPADLFSYVPAGPPVNGIGSILLGSLIVAGAGNSVSPLLAYVDPRNARLATVSSSYLVTVARDGAMAQHQVWSLRPPV